MDELYQQHASGAGDDDATRGRADASLVAMLRTDGAVRQSAIAQLYRRYGRDFKAYFRRHGAGEALAEDVLQETSSRCSARSPAGTAPGHSRRGCGPWRATR